MNSKPSFIICAIFLLVSIATSNGQFTISRTGAIKASNQCLNSITQEAKEKCLLDACRSQNPSKFECRALQCKLTYPGIGVQNKKNILRCVKGVCASNPGQSVCQGIKTCESGRNGATGEAKYIVCISKLFPRN